MDALLALHGEMDSKASRVGINDAVYQRFYHCLRDAELVTVSAKRIISAKALKPSTNDDDFLDIIVREAEAEKQATRKLLRELPKKVGEKKALKVVQELPDELTTEAMAILGGDTNLSSLSPKRIQEAYETLKAIHRTGMAGLCFYCNKPGHQKRSCPNKDTPQTEEGKKAEQAFAEGAGAP